jgi:drug/metabolite transporter (DMT)-like permease
VINIVIPFTLITWAEQSVASAIAAILNGAVPLLVIVLAALVFADEPITLGRLVGVIVGYVGVVVLVAPGLAGALSGSEVTGEVALLGSTVSYAVGAVYARRNIKGLRPMIPAVFQVGFAFLIVATLALLFEKPLAVAWNTNALIAVLWLGLLGSGAAYLIMFRLLGRIGATATSQLAYLLPVVGIVTGALMFNEAVDGRVIGGTALILGGVTLVNSRFGTRRIFGRRPAERSPDASTGSAA